MVPDLPPTLLPESIAVSFAADVATTPTIHYQESHRAWWERAAVHAETIDLTGIGLEPGEQFLVRVALIQQCRLMAQKRVSTPSRSISYTYGLIYQIEKSDWTDLGLPLGVIPTPSPEVRERILGSFFEFARLDAAYSSSKLIGRFED